MKKIYAPSAGMANDKPGKLYHCHPSHEGCGSDVLKDQYNPYAMLCKNCTASIAGKYGLLKHDANYAQIEHSTQWFDRDLTNFKGIEKREKIRILAFACGCHGVLNLTEKEKNMAFRIREIYPWVYREWNSAKEPEWFLAERMAF